MFRRSIVYFAACTALAAAYASVGAAAETSPEKERELIAVLRSDAQPGEKAIACKLLAIHGSGQAVGALAPLLSDEQLASWARIALEAIPGAEADKALRDSTSSLHGRLLVGAINSIGVRQDAQAVELLTQRLADQDAEVASAAAVALGHIGNEAAATSLRQALAAAPAGIRSSVAEGCVLCAERFHAAGNAAEAVEIYDEVRKSDVPKPRILEATRGAILARNQEGIGLLLEQFRSPDYALFQIALSTAREFPGDDVDRALATELANAPPDRAALMILAMADRPDTVVLPAITVAAADGPKPVRLAAMDALRRVGDASCLTTLLETSLEADADLSQAAKLALSELPGEDVDQEIRSLLANAEERVRPVLIGLVGQRRIEATATLLAALDDPDQAVRHAAIAALGETVGQDGLPVLIARVTAPEPAADAAVELAALKAASIRMPDRDECAAALAAAFDESPSVPTKVALLDTLGAVGGTKALAAVGGAAKSDNPQLQDAATRLLGEWMTADAAPVLLDLAQNVADDRFQVRSLRGYLRIARQFDLPEQERIDMCEKALAAARAAARLPEQELVLETIQRYPAPRTLALAIRAMANPELKEKATAATLAIAQDLAGKGVDVAEQLSQAGFEKVKLEIVKAEYGAGSTQRDVTAILQQRAGDLPLVTLPSASFNESFGGDPVPGTAKQLKIQYRINGKPGEVTIDENSMILLPLPEIAR
jgi:HEAT repeat protein